MPQHGSGGTFPEQQSYRWIHRLVCHAITVLDGATESRYFDCGNGSSLGQPSGGRRYAGSYSHLGFHSSHTPHHLHRDVHGSASERVTQPLYQKNSIWVMDHDQFAMTESTLNRQIPWNLALIFLTLEIVFRVSWYLSVIKTIISLSLCTIWPSSLSFSSMIFFRPDPRVPRGTAFFLLILIPTRAPNHTSPIYIQHPNYKTARPDLTFQLTPPKIPISISSSHNLHSMVCYNSSYDALPISKSPLLLYNETAPRLNQIVTLLKL